VDTEQRLRALSAGVGARAAGALRDGPGGAMEVK
jgi:hypothetical protein